MKTQRPDFYYKKAKSTGYLARSVFKLEEIDRKYKLFRAGKKILDLGCAPGSWMQYIAEKVGPQGLVVGVDLKEVRGIGENLQFIEADIFKMDVKELRKYASHYDVVVSDMAPQTTGNREGDHSRSMELCHKAFEIAQATLKPKGCFVCKMFQGAESKLFLDELNPHFEMVKTQKPSASRDESREVYVVALGFARLRS